MDLLGGYKSDGDSTSASSSSSHSKTAASFCATKSTVDQNLLSSPPEEIPPVNIANKVQDGYKTLDNIEIKQKQRGKRLLRLNAILPPEIFERLSRSTARRAELSNQGNGALDKIGNQWSDSSSDSESEENVSLMMRGEKRRRTDGVHPQTIRPKKDHTASDMMADPQLRSLLSDLKSHVPATGQTDDDIAGKKEKLGMGFLNIVSTSVVRKKRHEPEQVVDIHGNPSSLHSLDDAYKGIKPQSSHETQTLTESEDMGGDASSTTVPPPSVTTTHQLDDDYEHGLNCHVSPDDGMYPEQNIAESTEPRRPLAGIQRIRNAAPSVNLMPGVGNDEGSKFTAPLPTEVPTNEDSASMSVSQTNPPRKMSKKELEKALRAGNFETLQDCTQKIDAPNQIPHSASSLVLEGGVGIGEEGGSSFRTSGLERYVPSEGVAVKQAGLSAKMRGKHQIHSLVMSASKYEADQRRMAAMGMGQQGKSKRADAKKKYGW